jgi:hypothetical protein
MVDRDAMRDLEIQVDSFARRSNDGSARKTRRNVSCARSSTMR